MTSSEDRKLRQLKVATLIGHSKQREAMQSALLRISQLKTLIIDQPLSPTVIHWPISEVDEGDHEETRLRLRTQTGNPLYTAAVKRLLPYFSRKCTKELHTWRLLTIAHRFALTQKQGSRSQRYQHYFRVMNLVGRRSVMRAWTGLKKRTVEEEVEEAEETVVSVRRRVTVERITYFRDHKTFSQPQFPTMDKLRKALLSSSLRDRAVKCLAFERLRTPPPTPIAALRLPALRKALTSARLRQKLTILTVFLSLKPAKVVTVALSPAYLQSIKAVTNLLADLLSTHAYTPVFTALRTKDLPESGISTPLSSPMDTIGNEQVSPNKVSLRLVHFERKIRRVFKGRTRWAFKSLMASHPKYQRRRFYRIQKGMKALYTASILSVQNDVFELLRFLLYMKGKRGKLGNLPLFAYPTKSVVHGQRLVRGFLARRYVKRLRVHMGESKEEMVGRYQIAVKSVVLIQRLARGFLARKLADRLRVTQQMHGQVARPQLRGQVLSSRVFMLVKALSHPVKRYQGLVIPRLSAKNHRKQIRRCIRLQRAAKEMQKAIQVFAFRTIKAGSSE